MAKVEDYGSGVAGDLFVHLFSGVHFITGAKGPTRAMATGGLRFWKDGRDVYDVMLALFDHPEGFNLSLQVNMVDGGKESEGFLFTGSEGLMEVTNNSVTVTRTPRETEPRASVSTFAEAQQKELLEQYHAKYPPRTPEQLAAIKAANATQTFSAPAGYSDTIEHFQNFFNAVRSRQPVVEDAMFGFRAAGAALLSNLSIERQQVVRWDPNAMRVVP